MNATQGKLFLTAELTNEAYNPQTWRLTVKSREVSSREIGCYNHIIVPKFDRHTDSAGVDVPVKL